MSKMGRPQKDNADWFPMEINGELNGVEQYLRQKFGAEGFLFLYVMIRELAKSKKFRIKWDDMNIDVCVASVNIDKKKFGEMLSICCSDSFKTFEIVEDYLQSDWLNRKLKPLVRKREYMRMKHDIEEQQKLDALEIGIDPNDV